MKKITILGATGSIGTQTLQVIQDNSDQFEVVAISCKNNFEKLIEILTIHKSIKYVCIFSLAMKEEIKTKFPNIEIFIGEEGLIKISTLNEIHTVVNSLVGFAGLNPTVAAIEHKKQILLANKEILVVAGELIIKLAKKNKVKIIPIDSEHSAILQCLQGNKFKEVKKIILTASGGSFRNFSLSELENVTKEQALNHPNWKMGKKITIDSATMMNKGFELIEAHFLFGINIRNIEILLHPESIIHSMVEYHDGAIIAQLSEVSMKIPIQYALSYPKRIKNKSNNFLDLTKQKSLTFAQLDFKKYPILESVYYAIEKKGSMLVALNASNEVAVNAFLNDQIKFLDIAKIIAKVLKIHKNVQKISLTDIININEQICLLTQQIIQSGGF